MVLDVTERIRSDREMRELLGEKERLRLNLEAIFRAIPDAIVVVDTQMRVIQTNRPLTDVCFVGEGLTDPSDQRVVSGACHRGCFAALRETLATRRPLIEYRVECKGQNPGRVVVINSTPLSGHDGAFMVELHVGIGFYRILVKWGFLDRPGRKIIKRKENLLTGIFIAVGLLTLLRYYFLPLK